MNCPLTPIIHGRDAKAALHYRFLRWLIRRWWHEHSHLVQKQVADQMLHNILYGKSKKSEP